MHLLLSCCFPFFHVYRLRAARVLVIGLGGLGAEVVKNIVLSGIKSIVLLDHVLVSQLLFKLIPTDSSLFLLGRLRNLLFEF